MDLYADVLELIARALRNAVLAAVAAVVVGALLVALLGMDWLALVASAASLAPVLAVIATTKGHAAAIRERVRRAAYR